MNRRKYLALTATLLTTAGCVGGQAEEETATETETVTTVTETTTMTLNDGDEPTVRTTTTPESDAEKVLTFGDWHSHLNWGITVQRVELATKFDDSFAHSENPGSHEMPDDKQLLFVSIQMKNLSQDERNERNPYEPWFAAVADSSFYESVGSFDHPDYSDPVDMDWIDLELPGSRIGGTETVASGDTIDRWTGHVLPRDTKRSQIQIGFRDSSSNGYPIRWEKSK